MIHNIIKNMKDYVMIARVRNIANRKTCILLWLPNQRIMSTSKKIKVIKMLFAMLFTCLPSTNILYGNW